MGCVVESTDYDAVVQGFRTASKPGPDQCEVVASGGTWLVVGKLGVVMVGVVDVLMGGL